MTGFAESLPLSNRAIKRYRLVLGLSILLNIVVGIIILIWPDQFTGLLGQPEPFPKTWPRHWGAQLLAITLLYLPGLWQPREHTWPNWLGIGIRLSFSAFFIMQGDGFVPMGIYDGVSGLALLATYIPALRSRG